MTYTYDGGLDGGTTEATLTENDVHRLLASERRRILLDVLEDRPTPTDLEWLARSVARRESVTGREPDGVERVLITLHHTHLPKLAERGVVEYDPDTGRVEAYHGLVA